MGPRDRRFPSTVADHPVKNRHASAARNPRLLLKAMKHIARRSALRTDELTARVSLGFDTGGEPATLHSSDVIRLICALSTPDIEQ
jgi:hypothetical protein